MLKGLFVSRQYRESVWERDFSSSDFWDTEKFGIKMDVCKNHKKTFKNINSVINKYDFFMTEEIWTDKFRKRVLEPIRKNSNKKVFLISQEPFKPDNKKMELAYFFRKNYSMGPGDYFFIPDAVFTPGTVLNSWWNTYTTCNTYLTGYPRFDFYSTHHQKFNRDEARKKYGLSTDKKLIFFISFGAYMYTEPEDLIDPDKDNDTNRIPTEAGYVIDLHSSREETLLALYDVAKNNNYQVVVKIHPMSFKVFVDGGGFGKEVAGTLKKYYENPSEHMVVIGDEWNNGNISKELLCASDVVCGWGSTMLLEAMMLKKPVINVEFGKTSKFNLYKEFNDIFYTASSTKELNDLLSKELIAVYDENMITKYFYKNDGKTCERVCDAIKAEMSLKKRTPKLIKEMIPKNMVI